MNDLKFQKGKGLAEIKPFDADFGTLRANLISDIEGDYLVDNIFVKGVSTDRSKNETNYDY